MIYLPVKAVQTEAAQGSSAEDAGAEDVHNLCCCAVASFSDTFVMLYWSSQIAVAARGCQQDFNKQVCKVWAASVGPSCSLDTFA